MAQRVLYYLRNLLPFAIGIDELERNQPVQILQKVIRHAYDPLASVFLLGGVAAQSYILQDRTNVSLHKAGTALETADLIKGL